MPDTEEAQNCNGRNSKNLWFLLPVLFIGPLVFSEVAPRFGLNFPVSDPEAMLWLVPRLSGDLACLGRFAEPDFIANYPMTYLNLALWMSLFGLVLGCVLAKLVIQERTVCANLLASLNKPLDIPPSISRFWLGIGGFGAMAYLAFSLAFRWSTCFGPSSGISIWRIHSGLYASTALALMGAMLTTMAVFFVWLRLGPSRPS